MPRAGSLSRNLAKGHTGALDDGRRVARVGGVAGYASSRHIPEHPTHLHEGDPKQSAKRIAGRRVGAENISLGLAKSYVPPSYVPSPRW